MIDVVVAAMIEPSPWNAVTITTGAVSAVALFLGIWNATRVWVRDHPTVHWAQEWDIGDEYGDLITDAVRFVASNRGRGIAQDVRVMSGGKELAKVDELRFNQRVMVWLTREGLSGPIEIVDGVGGTMYVEPGAKLVDDMALVIEWSQLPRLKKRRSKRYKFRGNGPA